MTTPNSKQEYIEFLAYYFIGKEQWTTIRGNCNIEYYYKHLPDLYNYKYLWTFYTAPPRMCYKMSYIKSKYTLTTLKNMLKSLDIDVEHEYASFKNKEERFHLKHITIE
jgi:hypothetical protein